MEKLSIRIAFNEEQSALLDTATAFCRQKSPIRAVRNQIATDNGFDHGLWNEMAALGWTGIAIPEQYGGAGLSLAEVITIAEPMGRYLFATPFASTQIFSRGLLVGGSTEQQNTALTRICEGAIGTTALFESEGDWDLNHIDSSATSSGATVKLEGVKTLVCDAAVADFFLASVTFDGAPALVVLDAAQLPRGHIRPEKMIDETRRSFQLDLGGLTVPISSLITGAAATAALSAIRNTALLLASSEAVGGIAGALDVIIAYLNTRKAFGRKIGSYQSLKHTCAEILIGLERSRSHVYHAATSCAGNEDAEIAVRMAKAEAGDTFVFAGDRAIQFHGGFGFTYDCDAQLFLRRALWLQYSFGDAAHHRRRLSDLLLS
jgi:acyl-CoA dehydrogenase